MTELWWDYSPEGGWRAARGASRRPANIWCSRVDFRISIDQAGTFLACQYLDGSWVSESRWKTLEQAKDWCASQKIGGEE